MQVGQVYGRWKIEKYQLVWYPILFVYLGRCSDGQWCFAKVYSEEITAEVKSKLEVGEQELHGVTQTVLLNSSTTINTLHSMGKCEKNQLARLVVQAKLTGILS